MNISDKIFISAIITFLLIMCIAFFIAVKESKVEGFLKAMEVPFIFLIYGLIVVATIYIISAIWNNLLRRIGYFDEEENMTKKKEGQKNE